MSGKLLIFFLLGATLLLSVECASRSQRQRDVVDEESCEEDGGDGYDEDGIPNRAGAVRPVRKQNQVEDDWDGVEDPTDDDYLRYQNNNKEGICILERGKCPSGEWRMFKRHNETVCLKIFGFQQAIDARQAAEVCRTNHNSRVMVVDSQDERDWILSTELGGNISYLTMHIAGYRTRACKIDFCDKAIAFEEVDGTSDYKYLFSHWHVLSNVFYYSRLDCLIYLTNLWALPSHVVNDANCEDAVSNHLVLCGVTVM